MYEAKEQETILQDLQESTGGDAAKFEGTFEYDVLASNAIEFSKQEVEREQMYKAGFAATSFGEYLTMRAEEHGVNRLIFKVCKPAISGNENNYIEWGTSIHGVGRIAVKKLWNGNGTVKVIVTDANGQPASDHLLEEVRTYIETQRPIGATVTVVAPEVLALSIALTPTKGAGDSTAIQKAINDFFISTEFDGAKISYAKIGEIILTNSKATKIEDYDNLTINGAKDNIAVTNEQIPSVTEVTLNGG